MRNAFFYSSYIRNTPFKFLSSILHRIIMLVSCFSTFLSNVLAWEFGKFSLPLFAISFLEWHGKKKCDTFCNNFPKFHLSFISTYHQRLKLVWEINLISKVFEAIWNCEVYFSHPNFCSIMVIILHKIKNIGNVYCAFAKYYYDFKII